MDQQYRDDPVGIESTPLNTTENNGRHENQETTDNWEDEFEEQIKITG